MDDRRFDALTRSLASGNSRRQMLKALLGVGGAVAAISIGQEVEAARRPTPTARPVSCPGSQRWSGVECICPTSNTKCGPACCPDGQAECCDNACCFGHCYGEELCCPNPRAFCPITGECCPEGWTCCPDFGCIPPDQCCTAGDCDLQACLAAICTEERFCAYVEDCLNGADCCGDGVCQDDGSCCMPDCPAGSCGSDGCDGACSCGDGDYCSLIGRCCENMVLPEAGCFWLENESGNACWVPFGGDFERCRAIDDCGEGGGGMSPGGCFKWSTSSADPGSNPPW